MEKYVAVSIRKIVKDRDEARKFVDKVRLLLAELKETEVVAQYVDKLIQELTSPHPTDPT